MPNLIFDDNVSSINTRMLSHTYDLVIFIEDGRESVMWLNILNKFLPQKDIKVGVFPYNGRTDVIKKCKSDQRNSEYKRLYIIDADWDLISGETGPVLKHFYKLNAFCIENYLIQEDAIVKLIHDYFKNEENTVRKIKQKFDFCEWVEKNSDLYKKLFVIYTVNQILRAGVKIMDQDVKALIDKDSNYDLSENKVNKRIEFVLSGMVKKESDIKKVKGECEERIKEISILNCISGKRFLLSHILLRIKVIFGRRRITEEDAKRILSAYISNEVDKKLVQVLDDLVN